MIYFVQDSVTRCIKIGFTDHPDVSSRVSSLQVGNPSALVLLLAIPGEREHEEVLHAEFSFACERGEWFRPVPSLLQLMIRLAAHQGAIDALLSQNTPSAPRGASHQRQPGKVKAAILNVFRVSPTSCFSPGEMAQLLDLEEGTVRKELWRLYKAGVLQKIGNKYHWLTEEGVMHRGDTNGETNDE